MINQQTTVIRLKDDPSWKYFTLKRELIQTKHNPHYYRLKYKTSFPPVTNGSDL